MKRFYISAIFAGFLSLLSASSLFGEDESLLIDDFELGYAGNKIGTYWYFLCDTNSTIENAGALGLFTGAYEPGKNSSYAGIMEFSVKGGQFSFANIGFNFDNSLRPIDCTGATEVQFDIKGNRSMNINFVAPQSTIIDFSYYYSTIAVTTSWKTVSIKLAAGTDGLTKMQWGQDVPFAKDKLTGFYWVYTPSANPGSSDSSGTVSIDNVKIIGNPSGLQEPFPVFIWGVIMDVSPTMVWYKNPAADSYCLQVSKANDFSSFEVNKPGITDTTYTVSDLTPGTKYYWRVNASSGGEGGRTGRWSWIGIFTAPASATVTYDGNGNDDGTVPSSRKYITDASVTVSDNTGNLTKDGSTFSGWNTKSDGNGDGYAAGDTFVMGTSDITLYAQWTKNETYSVTYKGNGNDDGDVPSSKKYAEGATVTVSDNTGDLEKSGYDFAEWNTKSDGSGKRYAAGETFTMKTSNVMLYAQWKEKATYSVTYKGNGNNSGSVPESQKYIEGATVTISDNTGNIKKIGSVFFGWNTKADGSGKSYEAGATFTMGTSAVTLYAQWKQTYRVSYDDNKSDDGDVPASVEYVKGAMVTVSGNTGALKKNDNVFVGWNTKADGKGTTYMGGATFTMGTSDVTLYAQWTTHSTFSVYYKGNGNISGEVPTDENNYLRGTRVIILGNTGNMSKTGYAFTDWNTKSNGDGNGFAPGDTFTIDTSDVTLYAQWTVKPTYSVTYKGNGATAGSAPTDGNNYYEGDTVTVLGNTDSLVKSDMIFAGWNTAANGSGTHYDTGDTFVLGPANIRLYAQWTFNTYTLTIKRLPYRMVLRSPVEKIRDTVVMAGDTILLTTDSKAGCSFVKWEVTDGEAILLDSTESTCRIILVDKDAELTFSELCPMKVKNSVEKIPTRFGLNCNGKMGIITYAIPKVTGCSSVPVSIRLFDLRGQLLGVIIDNMMKPGHYTAAISSQKKIATGMIICRMESLGYRSVVKIVTK